MAKQKIGKKIKIEENYKFCSSAPAKLGKARQSKTMFVICSSLESGAKRKSFLLVLVLHVKLKVKSILFEVCSKLKLIKMH